MVLRGEVVEKFESATLFALYFFYFFFVAEPDMCRNFSALVHFPFSFSLVPPWRINSGTCALGPQPPAVNW